MSDRAPSGGGSNLRLGSNSVIEHGIGFDPSLCLRAGRIHICAFNNCGVRKVMQCGLIFGAFAGVKIGADYDPG